MSILSTSEFRNGVKVLLENEPCVILENEFVKPGKGQAFNRVKLRNLKTGRVLEKTFKSGETLPAADVMDTEMQFLYFDGEQYHFMVQDTFEQHEISPAIVGETSKWLQENDICIVTLFNGIPLSVTPPNFVVLVITETDPGLRGDTSGGGGKAAILSTGAVVRVPLFVQTGEKIKVDTRTAEYVSRVKDE